MLAAVFVALILLVTLYLDRPQRGLIAVPSTSLDSLVKTMDLEPAASAPKTP